MSAVAVRVENLGQQYRIGGVRERYGRFTETLMESLAAPVRRAKQALQRSHVRTCQRPRHHLRPSRRLLGSGGLVLLTVKARYGQGFPRR